LSQEETSQADVNRALAQAERLKGYCQSALVDSLIFPTIAFSQILPFVVLGEWVAKITGGLIWYFLLKKSRCFLTHHTL